MYLCSILSIFGEQILRTAVYVKVYEDRVWVMMTLAHMKMDDKRDSFQSFEVDKSSEFCPCLEHL